MANTRSIKSRIKSAKNIAQITKAMEMVSASKMKRAQDRVHQSQPYAEKLAEIFGSLSQLAKNTKHPLLRVVENPQKILIVLVSTDKGLAGALNSNVFRELGGLVRQLSAKGSDFEYITIGRKGRDFLRYTRRTISAVFDGMSDRPHFSQVQPIASIIIDGFAQEKYDAIYLAYPHFVSTLVQKPIVKQLLPVILTESSEKHTESGTHPVPLFEPSPEEILEKLLPYYVEQTIFQTILDASASEHSARMIAMKNATDNAKDVQKSLQLQYNNVRQAQITQQIAEIASATMI
jgi:F-type H+-transporting ATPase subunit gamma